MTTLKPVYQRVAIDTVKDPEVYEMEDLSKDKEPQATPVKNSKKKRCAKRCVVGLCLVLFALSFIGLIAIGVVGHRVKTCLFSGINNVKSFSYDPSTLDLLYFDIPTGSISVHTCNHATNVSVTITTGAKSEDLLQEIATDIKETPNSLRVIAQSPTFNMQSCQIVHVQVVIPATSMHPISLSASAALGSIRLSTESFTFAHVDLNVTIGLIKLHNLDTDSLSAKTSLGVIHGSKLKSNKDMTAHAEIGGLCLRNVDASKTTLQVQKGVLRARHFQATSMSTKVDFGFSSLSDVYAPFIESEVNFGKLSIAPKKGFSGEVVFNTTLGHFDLFGPSDIPLNVVSPTCKIAQVKGESGISGVDKMIIKTNSASADVHVY